MFGDLHKRGRHDVGCADSLRCRHTSDQDPDSLGFGRSPGTSRRQTQGRRCTLSFRRAGEGRFSGRRGRARDHRKGSQGRGTGLSWPTPCQYPLSDISTLYQRPLTSSEEGVPGEGARHEPPPRPLSADDPSKRGGPQDRGHRKGRGTEGTPRAPTARFKDYCL